jgi:hypothetical protein
MAVEIMLTPRPQNASSIARVIALINVEQTVTVLDIESYEKSKGLLKEAVPEVVFAYRLWSWISAAIFWGAIVLSFVWHWWAFIVGSIVAWMIWRGQRQSIAQWLLSAFQTNPEATLAVFQRHGTVFNTDLGSGPIKLLALAGRC